MQIELSSRSSGKTAKAVKWVKEGRIDGQEDTSNRIIVVISEGEKRRLMEAFHLGYHEVESYETVLHSYHLPVLRKKELFLDNADIIIQRLFYGLVRCISLTKGEENFNV